MKLRMQMGTAITAAKATGLRDWGSISGNSETESSKAHALGQGSSNPVLEGNCPAELDLY